MKHTGGTILPDRLDVALKTLTFDPVTLAHSHVISETWSGHCGHRRTVFLLVPYDTDLALCTQTRTVSPKGDYLLQ